MVANVSGHEVTGVVIGGETHYGPFVHNATDASVFGKITASGELWGTEGRIGWGEAGPTVRAFSRPGEPLLPNAVEFYTRTKPSNMTPIRLGGPRWAAGSPDVGLITVPTAPRIMP